MSEPIGTQAVEAETSTTEKPTEAIRIRYRIRFAKTGLLRWISHRDLARLWERLLRRARLKLSMTEGFHPKPRVSFPSALALGVESHDEVVEIELAEPWDATALLQKLRDDNQPGLTIKSVDQLPPQFGKAQLQSSDYTITVVAGLDPAAIVSAIDQLYANPTVQIERKGKPVTIDVAAQIESIEHCDKELKLTLAASETATLRPSDVLDLLGFDDWIERGSLITRVRVHLQKEFNAPQRELNRTDPN
jgi:radical SAM-linked protein